MGEKRRVTFEVNTSELFDMLAKLEGNTDALGGRLVECLLEDCGYFQDVGLALYGITIIPQKTKE